VVSRLSRDHNATPLFGRMVDRVEGIFSPGPRGRNSARSPGSAGSAGGAFRGESVSEAEGPGWVALLYQFFFDI
jgi:hypothetical protein